jgi:hypothetical protein
MLALESFLNPVTFGYLVDTPWGSTRQWITVNSPGTVGNDEAERRLGREIWMGVTAPAVTSSVHLTLQSVTHWKGLALSVPVPVADAAGELHAFTAPREHSAQLLLLTGHPGDDGKRRLFLPGVPRHWVANELLTPTGWEQLMAHARALIMGMGPPNPGGTLEWLLPYPEVLEPTINNPRGVAFRRVQHVRVCYHTDRAPDVTGLGQP